MNSAHQKTPKTRYYTCLYEEYVEICIFNMATGSHLGFRPLVAIRSRLQKSTCVIFKGSWASNSNQISKCLADELYTGSWSGPGLRRVHWVDPFCAKNWTSFGTMYQKYGRKEDDGDKNTCWKHGHLWLSAVQH